MRCYNFLLLVVLLLLPLTATAADCQWTAGAAPLSLHPCLETVTDGAAPVQPAVAVDRPPGALRHEEVSLTVSGSTSNQTAAQPAVLWLGVPSALFLQVWLISNDQPPRLLLEQTPDSPFTSRPLAAGQLAVPVDLPPGAVRLRFDYHLHLNGRLQPRLYAPIDWQASELGRSILNGVLLGAVAVLALGLLVAQSVTGETGYHRYILLISAEILLLFQNDGHLFQFLWPDWPQLNHRVPALTSSLGLSAHILFARQFFQLPHRYPRLSRLHNALLALVVINLILLTAYGLQLRLLVLMTFAYAPLAIITGLRVYRDKLPGTTQYLIGTGLLILCTTILLPISTLGANPLPTVDFFLYPKIGFVLEAAFFYSALMSRINAFRRHQAEERRRRLTEVEELLHAERQRREALALARENSLKLATASHDISQPLASLRFAIETLRRGSGTTGVADHLDRTVDYAQTLLHDIMRDSRAQSSVETIALGRLLADLAAEHHAAAQAKGLSLRVVGSSIRLDASYLVLRRIINNLLANAVRYTEQGRILIGVRRRPGAVEIQVLDSGPGLLPGDEIRLQQAFAQQDGQHGGFGLGLYSVKSLCDQMGYRLTVHSRRHHGSRFAVWLPKPKADGGPGETAAPSAQPVVRSS